MGEKLNLEQIVEALLFTYGEPLSVKKICALTKKQASEINAALDNLKTRLERRGIKLVSKNDDWQLAASAEASPYIEKLIKSEIQEGLTPAGLEILAVVAYRGPVSKSEIETIRGVNSTYTLRNLTVRGLVEKNESAKPSTYEISLAALRKLGLERTSNLPKYAELKEEINAAEQIITVNS